MTGGLFTNSVSACVAVPPLPSLTDTENEKVPATVGVPLSNPALDKDKPVGSVLPLVRLQVSASPSGSVA